MRFLLLIVITMILYPATVYAKDGQEIIFDRYIVKNTFYTAQLQLKAKRIFRATFPACQEKQAYVRLKPAIIVPPLFTVSEDIEALQNTEYNALHPSFGQWVEQSKIHACGKNAVINILVTAHDHAHVPIFFPLLNGTTDVDIKLQSHAEKITGKAIADNTDCRDQGVVLNTEIIGYLSQEGGRLTGKNEDAGWFEKWTIESCKKIHEVNLAILPDPRKQFRFVAELKTSSSTKEQEDNSTADP